MRFALGIGAVLAAFAMPAAAKEYEAYIVSGASLLAGPAVDYPAVVSVSPGEPVHVYGCLPDYSWCDVSFQGYRGWFDGRQLAHSYNGVRVPLSGFGGEIGVPVVVFSLDDYWGRFYRDRPFYRDRARWAAAHEVPSIGEERVHGPVREHGAPGPHLPPTPTLQPGLRNPQVRQDTEPH
jgi:uncharacterized protein YraI